MRIPPAFRLALCVGALAAWGQSPVGPRAPEQYKASAKAGKLGLAADFHAHTVPSPGGSFLVKDYVVVEVAIFPGRGEEVPVNAGRFSLRINGAKAGQLAQLPGMVAASLKYPNYGGGPRMTAAAGVGDAGVILGGDSTPRFPGDPRARRLPRVEPVPGPGAQQQQEEKTPAWDWVTQLALEERNIDSPAAGLLYFPYNGKLEKIKVLELLYAGPEGDAVLVLRRRN